MGQEADEKNSGGSTMGGERQGEWSVPFGV